MESIMGRKSPQTLPITDPDLIRRIEKERIRRGQKKPTQTANTLLIERLFQLENEKPMTPPLPGA